MESTHKIILKKNSFKFSAAHFTIFDEFKREMIHGHNWRIEVALNSKSGTNGLCYDYNIVSDYISRICQELDERLILPSLSMYLNITKNGSYIEVKYGADRFVFPSKDVVLLDIINVTGEELSKFILKRIIKFMKEESLKITGIEVCVYSGDQGICSELKVDM